MRANVQETILACKRHPRALIFDTSFSAGGVDFDDSLKIALIIVASHTELLVDVLLLDDLSSVLLLRLEDRVIDFLFTILDQFHETSTTDLLGLGEKKVTISLTILSHNFVTQLHIRMRKATYLDNGEFTGVFDDLDLDLGGRAFAKHDGTSEADVVELNRSLQVAGIQEGHLLIQSVPGQEQVTGGWQQNSAVDNVAVPGLVLWIFKADLERTRPVEEAVI